MSWPTPPQPQNDGNYNALLGGGKSVKSASFKGQFPVRWEGELLDCVENIAYEYDPSKPGNRGAQKFWPDGNPVKYLWLTVQTGVHEDQDDDGRRVIVLDSKNKADAVKAAVAESGADFAKGGRLILEWYGNDPNGKNPDNPPKLYRALWTGPTFNSALAGPPTPAASAPQANWGGPAPTASPAPATGGWGQPAPQAAPAGWGAPAPAAASPAPQAGGWGSPAPVAPQAPTFDELVAQGGPPAVLEALRKKGVPGDQVTSPEQAAQIWALVRNNPDVA